MDSILSYSDLQKQWNTENDIEHVINDLNNKKDSIETLKFSGNTLGVAAAEKLTEPLSNHSKLKRLLWNDLFTGRLKTEIGVALKALSVGLMKAHVNLVELDLSDNAFGPNGVVGVTDLLASPCCYTLKILNMNNQGLGHQGCRHLVDALKTARINSGKKGMNLEVFIAGRNRLENPGMEMLSEVFGDGMSSLKKLVLLQNGIGIHGIAGVESLIASIKNHTKIQILNISDNTIKPKGVRLLSSILPYFEDLEELYLGDCLIGNKGVNNLTKILDCMSNNLKKISVSGNEVNGKAAKNFLNAIVESKSLIESIDLTENEIKNSYKCEMIDILKEFDKSGVLVEDDNDEDEEDDESESEVEDSEENYDEESGEETDSEVDDDDESDNEEDYNENEIDKQELVNNSIVERKVESVTAPTNIFSNNKSVESPFLFTKNVNNGVLFNSKPTGSNLFKPDSNARLNLFSKKTSQSSIFSTNENPIENKFVFGEQKSNVPTNQPFSFLEAANISKNDTNVEEKNKWKKSILENLKSESIMSIKISSLKVVNDVNQNLVDNEILQLAESNPENAIRVGLVLCDNELSFEIGMKLIHCVLTSNKTWSVATNALLVEMNCIKGEEKNFIPYCNKDNTLAIKVIKKMLEMNSGVPNDVRLNLSTVLKNLNKYISDDADLLLKQLESGLTNMHI